MIRYYPLWRTYVLHTKQTGGFKMSDNDFIQFQHRIYMQSLQKQITKK